MIRRIALVSLLGIMVFAAAGLAHGDKTHVMGTVAELDAAHLTVQTTDGKTVSIRLAKKTEFRRGAARVSASDLKVGDRVVVEAVAAQDGMMASEIRMASGAKGDGHESQHRRP